MEHLQSALFGWPYFFALAIPAIPFILGRAKKTDWLMAASALTIVVAYVFYFYDAIVWNSFPRYWYPAVIGLALLTARGFQELYRWPLRLGHHLPASKLAAALPVAALLGILLAFNLGQLLPATSSMIKVWNAGDLNAVKAVQKAHIHHAVVFQVQGKNYWWPYGGVFFENSPLLNGDIVWARDEGGRDRRLMRLFPGRSYYRLDNETLTRLKPTNSLQHGRKGRRPHRRKQRKDSLALKTAFERHDVRDILSGPL